MLLLVGSCALMGFAVLKYLACLHLVLDRCVERVELGRPRGQGLISLLLRALAV